MALEAFYGKPTFTVVRFEITAVKFEIQCREFLSSVL
jgi:hypothetical protein